MAQRYHPPPPVAPIRGLPGSVQAKPVAPRAVPPPPIAPARPGPAGVQAKAAPGRGVPPPPLAPMRGVPTVQAKPVFQGVAPPPLAPMRGAAPAIQAMPAGTGRSVPPPPTQFGPAAVQRKAQPGAPPPGPGGRLPAQSRPGVAPPAIAWPSGAAQAKGLAGPRGTAAPKQPTPPYGDIYSVPGTPGTPQAKSAAVRAVPPPPLAPMHGVAPAGQAKLIVDWNDEILEYAIKQLEKALDNKEHDEDILIYRNISAAESSTDLLIAWADPQYMIELGEKLGTVIAGITLPLEQSEGYKILLSPILKKPERLVLLLETLIHEYILHAAPQLKQLFVIDENIPAKKHHHGDINAWRRLLDAAAHTGPNVLKEGIEDALWHRGNVHKYEEVKRPDENHACPAGYLVEFDSMISVYKEKEVKPERRIIKIRPPKKFQGQNT